MDAGNPESEITVELPAEGGKPDAADARIAPAGGRGMPRVGAALSNEQLRRVLDHQAAYLRGRDGARTKELGALLVEEGLITPAQLDAALERQRGDRGRKLGHILEDMGAATAEEVHLVLARKLGIPFLRLRDIHAERELLAAVPYDIARRYGVLPLFMHRGRLVLAAEDPINAEALDVVRFISGCGVEPVMVTREDLERALSHYYGAQGDIEAAEAASRAEGVVDADAVQDLRVFERLGREKPIVRLVNNIIADAISQKASDIHLRPAAEQVDLLYRVDGSLVRVRSFSRALLPAVVSRIKIIGRMDIAERRLPQDGRARVTDRGSTVDLRISVIPTVDGESVVIRLLNADVGLRDIGELGLNERDREAFVHLINRSHGMVLVTGPTGSGKSTTLYAALQAVKARNVNIITVENPVEYRIAGIQQIQVDTAPGYTFARALRHILRHDPDVVMVGEIRDQETARIAVESALTGHLVFSTLHTNDAATTVTRLVEMGVESYLVSATLLGVLAQRLVRVNCSHCMVEETVDPAVRRVLGVGDDEVFHTGAGCDLCNNTGFSGRMAVYELMVLSPELRDMITPRVSADELRRRAVTDGMTPLTANALERARAGVIPLSEVYRVRLE